MNYKSLVEEHQEHGLPLSITLIEVWNSGGVKLLCIEIDDFQICSATDKFVELVWLMIASQVCCFSHCSELENAIRTDKLPSNAVCYCKREETKSGKVSVSWM